MKYIRKALIWYYMYSKRLLHKLSFVILLCLIPALVPVAQNAMTGESGALTIALCGERDDESAENIINSLMENDGIIRYIRFETQEEAQKAVRNYEVDGAWIFRDKFSEMVDDYVSGHSKRSPVYVIERKSVTIPLRLSREILCGVLCEKLAYNIYEDFVYSEIVSEEELPQEAVREYFYSMPKNKDIIKIKRMNSEVEFGDDENYLTTPLRGILALTVMLCSFAAALYFVSDQSEGKYAWLRPNRRIIPAFALCFSATVLAGVAALAAMKFGGIFIGIGAELTSMLLFVIAASGFALITALAFKSTAKLGAVIPGLMILMMVLSPIFVSVKMLKPIRMLLPTHYYLNSVYNSEYIPYTVIYCAAIYLVAFALNAILNGRYSRSANAVRLQEDRRKVL